MSSSCSTHLAIVVLRQLEEDTGAVVWWLSGWVERKQKSTQICHRRLSSSTLLPISLSPHHQPSWLGKHVVVVLQTCPNIFSTRIYKPHTLLIASTEWEKWGSAHELWHLWTAGKVWGDTEGWVDGGFIFQRTWTPHDFLPLPPPSFVAANNGRKMWPSSMH